MASIAHVSATTDSCMTNDPRVNVGLLRQRESSKLELPANPVPWTPTTRARNRITVPGVWLVSPRCEDGVTLQADNRTRPHDQHYPTVTRNVLDRCRPLYSSGDPGCRSTLSARSGNRPPGMILLSILARTRALFRMRGTHLHKSIWLAYSSCRRRRGCSQMSTLWQ